MNRRIRHFVILLCFISFHNSFFLVRPVYFSHLAGLKV
jgi:hypothetical protein